MLALGCGDGADVVVNSNLVHGGLKSEGDPGVKLRIATGIHPDIVAADIIKPANVHSEAGLKKPINALPGLPPITAPAAASDEPEPGDSSLSSTTVDDAPLPPRATSSP